jgi:adenylate kinase
VRIVLLGAPGSGKGTQCRRIAGTYGAKHLSSGDILRLQRRLKTDLAKKAARFMDSGVLVPDDIIVEIMAGAVKQTGESGFVLDGFPRTTEQAAALDKILDEKGRPIEIVLNLEVRDGTVLQRLTGRRTCPECGAVYHVRTLRPKAEGRCDFDGTVLVQRADDVPEVVAKRLETYYDQTKPLVQYYDNKNILCKVDAEQDVEQVTGKIFGMLDGFYAGRDRKAICH